MHASIFIVVMWGIARKLAVYRSLILLEVAGCERL